MNNNEEYFISPTEFAEIFGISTTLVYTLIAEEHLPAIRLGKRNYRINSRYVELIKENGLLSGTGEEK